MPMRQVRRMTRDIIDEFEVFIYQQGWTQTDAAEKIGCSQEHLSRIFRRLRNPSAKLLDRMEILLEEQKYGELRKSKKDGYS